MDPEAIRNYINGLICQLGTKTKGGNTMVERDQLAVRQVLEDMIYAVADGLDQCDWGGLIGLFDDEVTFDYSSHTGRPAASISPQDWFERMRDARPGFDMTQHSLSNVRIRVGEGEASARAYVRAEHFFAAAAPDTQATIGGCYDFGFIARAGGWRIRLMRLNVMWKTGNSAIFSLAFSESAGR